jgi:hypothetical protein
MEFAMNEILIAVGGVFIGIALSTLAASSARRVNAT